MRNLTKLTNLHEKSISRNHCKKDTQVECEQVAEDDRGSDEGDEVVEQPTQVQHAESKGQTERQGQRHNQTQQRYLVRRKSIISIVSVHTVELVGERLAVGEHGPVGSLARQHEMQRDKVGHPAKERDKCLQSEQRYSWTRWKTVR